jgi:hypothetical protein
MVFPEHEDNTPAEPIVPIPASVVLVINFRRVSPLLFFIRNMIKKFKSRKTKMPTL